MARLSRVVIPGGSHHVFKHPGRLGHVVVPRSKKDRSVGLVAAICNQAGLWEMTMRYPVAIEPGQADRAFGVVTLDPAILDDATERVNITLPRRVLKRLDAQARRAGVSRSGYIAQMTLQDPAARAG